jgi:hypothetical protein
VDAPDRSEQRALAAAIRAGEWDDRWDEAVALVREQVRAKVDVAHPGWSDLSAGGG